MLGCPRKVAASDKPTIHNVACQSSFRTHSYHSRGDWSNPAKDAGTLGSVSPVDGFLFLQYPGQPVCYVYVMYSIPHFEGDILAAAIVHQILSVATVHGTNSDRLHKSCRILAESGILYTLSSALNLFASSLDTESRCFVLRLTIDAIVRLFYNRH